VKAVEHAKERLECLKTHIANTRKERLALHGYVLDIPKEGRWIPLRINRKGVAWRNNSLKLVEGRAYAIKNVHGQTISLWTERGWTEVLGMLVLSRLTHVWMPRKK